MKNDDNKSWHIPTAQRDAEDKRLQADDKEMCTKARARKKGREKGGAFGFTVRAQLVQEIDAASETSFHRITITSARLAEVISLGILMHFLGMKPLLRCERVI